MMSYHDKRKEKENLKGRMNIVSYSTIFLAKIITLYSLVTFYK